MLHSGRRRAVSLSAGVPARVGCCLAPSLAPAPLALLVARIILLYDHFAGRISESKEISQMKVVVDQKLCEGNMKCQEAAPEVFEVRDDDKSHLLIGNPPERMRDRVKLAARLCPRQAITVSDD
jgi:ferredoxin